MQSCLTTRERLSFKGDGTPEHPDRFHRDDFACLPFQLDHNRFAVGYYVVTRNMIHPWKKDADALDPARYDMPEQHFDLTLSNVRGEAASVSSYDPITDAKAPVKVVASTATTLTVRLATVDYPRFLYIEEAKPGPLVLSPQLKQKDGGVELSFSSNVSAKGKVTWGPLPQRVKSKELVPPPLALDGRGEGDPQRTREVALTAIAAQSLSLPVLNEDEGVRITLEHDGLIARWPLWATDVNGVLKFPVSLSFDIPTEAAAIKFPKLPQGPLPPGFFECRLPPNLKWNGAIGEQSLTTNGLLVNLRHVKGDLESLKALLPQLSAADKQTLEVVRLEGASGWQLDLELDGPAHPGLVELRQRHLVVPVGGGHVLLSFRGTRAAFEPQREVLQQITAGLNRR